MHAKSIEILEILKRPGIVDATIHDTSTGTYVSFGENSPVMKHTIGMALLCQSPISLALPNYRIIATRWNRLAIAVKYLTGHPASKSIRRTLNRAREKYDFRPIHAVQSETCNTSAAPPASSSAAPPTGVSSASPEERTPPTGASQEEKSSEANPLKMQLSGS